MPFASLRFFLSECLLAMRRHSGATLLTLLQCVASMTLLGIFLTIIINANYITSGFLHELELVVFLKPEVTNAEGAMMQQRLEGLPGVREITFVTKDEAYHRAQEMLQLDVNELLEGGNPFPASLEIQVTHAGALTPLQNYIAANLVGVEEVAGQDRYGGILPIMFFVQVIAFFLTLVLAGTTLFTIKNTIQLAIMSRRTEIKVMQLVGATPLFVRIPFLLEGLWYGAVGGFVAWLIIISTYGTAEQLIRASSPLEVMAPFGLVAFNTFLVLLVVGTLVGFVGALVSVDRHLAEKYKHSSAPGLATA